MGDLILSSYESEYSRRSSQRKGFYWVDVVVLMTLFGLLICNQKYAKSMEMQIVLTVFSLGAVFLILLSKWGDGLREKIGIEDCTLQMEQLESVLYHLDINTYNKLGLVLDELRDQIEYEEKEQRRMCVISYLGVAAVAGAFSFAHIDVKEIFIFSEISEVFNLFLILSSLLLTVFQIFNRMYSSNRKYRWLYNMLMNIMIMKY